MEKHTRQEKLEAFGRLADVLGELREKCPWDRVQTFESLRPNTIEEVYELCDAVLRRDWKNVCKELGDVLEHVIFYCLLGEEAGEFDLADVCTKEKDKLVFRHPHIYGRAEAGSAKEVLENWEQIKLREKDGNKTVLSGVPASLPSLVKAFRITEKASNVGFDWEKKEDVWDKVREEIAEFEEELRRGGGEARSEELGDLLFAIVNAARLYELNPDTALEKACRKFTSRFNYIESRAGNAGKNLRDMTLGEMDALWDEAKELEKKKNGDTE